VQLRYGLEAEMHVDRAELALLEGALARDMPVLAVCRGFQVLNVVRGGDLVQHLPDVVGDRRPVNQPGTIDEYPNWRVPMADEKERPVLLEELMTSPVASRLARLVTGSDA